MQPGEKSAASVAARHAARGTPSDLQNNNTSDEDGSRAGLQKSSRPGKKRNYGRRVARARARRRPREIEKERIRKATLMFLHSR